MKTKTKKIRRFFDNLMVVAALMLMVAGSFIAGYGMRMLQEGEANSLPIQLCPYIFENPDEAGSNLSVTYMEDASDLYHC